MNTAKTPGIKRDCTHPVARHVHGTNLAYKCDRCRCRPCRDAAAEYERHRSRMKAYGRWEPYVDAQPAREHVKLLSEQGMGWKRVAEKAGIQSSTVWKLMYGDPRRKTPLAPSKRVRRQTADKILAVELDLADAANVDATGTRRRLQALVAIGWSQTRLADQLGWNVGNINSLILGRYCPRVQHDTEVRVRALYDRLWNVPPVAANGHQRGGIAHAKKVAAKRGWVPPMAWDDDTIDDPAAWPSVGSKTPANNGGRPAQDVTDDVVWLLELDPWATARQLGERLGYRHQSGVQNALDRAGRADLLAQLARNAEVAS